MSLSSWLCSVPGVASACDYSGLAPSGQQVPLVSFEHAEGTVPICLTSVEPTYEDAYAELLNLDRSQSYTADCTSDLPISAGETYSWEEDSNNHNDHRYRQDHHHHYSSQSQNDSSWLGTAACGAATLALGAGGATVMRASKPLTWDEYEALPPYKKIGLRLKAYGLRKTASYLEGCADKQVPPIPTDEGSQGWLSWGGSMAWAAGSTVVGSVIDSFCYIRDTVTAASAAASERVYRWYTLGEESAKEVLNGTDNSDQSASEGVTTGAEGVTDKSEDELRDPAE